MMVMMAFLSISNSCFFSCRSHPGVGNSIGLGRMPLKHGACTAPAMGFDLRAVDENGNELSRGELGAMVIRTPLPPGAMTTLYNNDERYVQDYLTRFPGFYDTGDAIYVDHDGYYHIMGRTDDIINTAGHRLSTGGIEEILQSHPEVADCAVIALKDDLKGEVPIGFVITNKGL
jgi:propionyl-CoA synthetase